MDNVLFHTFTTRGYLHWADLYIESLRYLYGSDINIRIDSLNLQVYHKELLRHIHSNVDLRNANKSSVDCASELNISKERFERWKSEIEAGKITEENNLYKIYISVNQRYRNMYSVINEAREEGYDYLIHSDVDLYFRKDISYIFKLLKESEFAIYFRNRPSSQHKILGALLAFNLKENNNLDIFMSEWMDQIDKVPFKKRWRNFGQSVLWHTIENTKNDVNIVDLNSVKNAPKYSHVFNKKAHIWLNSNCFSIDPINTPRVISWNDFIQKFPRIEPNEHKSNLARTIFHKCFMLIEYLYIFTRSIQLRIKKYK